ncbi:MAG TPA: bifunctional (p)ppGpp synthetase/guanosine-3',5'-bis(diphosphate) 3'-pyrophosphohydrolase [Sedimenticola thiotaurini]|uniref:Bifunctional (P)ppGpp synthetase/guanosine-3',5'-bis(Diphosphate) 3'-pyrophosphohydrolase n=1 Tax=Sedimenticola thiotaurini TaxID=1543721 RepID=A0A831RLB9_9GAMM|nr:bifunctional (p)ppGpp synthetase/guanosine-3',5'-bis(diphosphate) 3'-pyrophosphohydrolase [Sedimenticola thiotaurini]
MSPDADLVRRAEIYATQAHERIDHRRKYSGKPYQEHLKAVADLVASVGGDPEMIAAAWLHDTVEDTPATLGQIEQEFGPAVAALVEQLTDVSRPGDGNRAARKAIDREHLAAASPRAKTVKLADLIDNCTDITRHDPRFARVYLKEMASLLEVLTEGDPVLLKRARKVHARSLERLARQEQETAPPGDDAPNPFGDLSEGQFRRMFSDIFTARDIAEPLLSFDFEQPAGEVAAILDEQREEVASVRILGRVKGFLLRQELDAGHCGGTLRHFKVDQVVSGSATLAEVVHVLTRHDYCFVTLLGEVVGVIRRDDINKPMVRMWLFGIITLIEMNLTRQLRHYFPDGGWQEQISPGRLQKAQAFREERLRRNQHCALEECLQLSDKGYVLIGHPEALKGLGFESRRSARRVMRDLESLRNNLAHAQDIATHDWAQIARLGQRLQELADR